MRTETITLFKYEELPSSSAAVALENWQTNEEYAGTAWQEENLESIKKGLESFDCELRDYSIDYYNASQAFTKFDSNKTNDQDELTGVRLATYLINNHWSELYDYKKKYWVIREDGTKHFNCIGDNTRTYTSNVQIVDSSCPFTGYCADENFLDPIRKFIQQPDESTTFIDLMQKAIDSVLYYMEKDYEYQLSEEYFNEHCSANDIEFNSDGTIYTPHNQVA